VGFGTGKHPCGQALDAWATPTMGASGKAGNRFGPVVVCICGDDVRVTSYQQDDAGGGDHGDNNNNADDNDLPPPLAPPPSRSPTGGGSGGRIDQPTASLGNSLTAITLAGWRPGTLRGCGARAGEGGAAVLICGGEGMQTVTSS
jgi:hypothetical protein